MAANLYQQVDAQTAEDFLDFFVTHRQSQVLWGRADEDHWMFRGGQKAAWTLEPSIIEAIPQLTTNLAAYLSTQADAGGGGCQLRTALQNTFVVRTADLQGRIGEHPTPYPATRLERIDTLTN